MTRQPCLVFWLMIGLLIERPYLMIRLNWKVDSEWNTCISLEKCTFHFEIHKTADFHSNLLVAWKLVTEGYQGRPMKCAYFKLKCMHFINRPLPGMVILCYFTGTHTFAQNCCIKRHQSHWGKYWMHHRTRMLFSRMPTSSLPIESQTLKIWPWLRLRPWP